MIRPPFVARVAAGLAVTVLEEAKKLPTTAVALPMTAVSSMLQTSMRLQQSITSLAIKGDQAFALISWSSDDDQPEWAVFDEDVKPATPDSDSQKASTNSGRFALYSIDPPTDASETTDSAAAATDESSAPDTDSDSVVAEPAIVTELDYADLTLAQLRARIRTLSVKDLTALLDYENRTRSRAPFVTMLTNRITTAKAK